MKRALRLFEKGFLLAWTLWQAAIDPRPTNYRERSEWLHRWSGILLRRLQLAESVRGTPPRSGLLVSNHLGYLDIIVYAAAFPCVFVSKAEVKKWPVLGWLVTKAGTIYVDRSRRTDTRYANEAIGQALAEGVPVVIFPEGTSSDGSEVLPFYASLFAPAVEGSIPITASHLTFTIEEGSVAKDVAYWGTMSFFPHLLRLLTKKGIAAEIRFADHTRIFDDRKIAATEMREEVACLSQRRMSPARTE